MGNIPQNQLNALPLIGISDVVEADETIVVGGVGVVRYWGPSSVGINGPLLALGDNGLQFGIFGNFLNMVGMRSFMVTIDYHITIAGAGAGGLGNLYADARVHGAAAYDRLDPYYNTVGGLILLANFTGSISGIPGAAPYSRKGTRGFGNEAFGENIGQTMGALVGGDIRFLFRNPTAPAGIEYFAHVYAQGP